MSSELTNSLYPLTEENNPPKALLPVANTPLLYFPLQWCRQAGFQSCRLLHQANIGVTVVCHTEALERITSYTTSLSLSMEISVEAPSSVEDNLGSAEVLAMVADKITVSLPVRF